MMSGHTQPESSVLALRDDELRTVGCSLGSLSLCQRHFVPKHTHPSRYPFTCIAELTDSHAHRRVVVGYHAATMPDSSLSCLSLPSSKKTTSEFATKGDDRKVYLSARILSPDNQTRLASLDATKGKMARLSACICIERSTTAMVGCLLARPCRRPWGLSQEDAAR